MDVTPYLESMHPAPRALFNAIPARRDQARFMLPDGEGGWSPMSWGAFGAEIEAITLTLEALGFGRGERGTILGHNSVSWMSAALAIQAAGGVMVPIYPSSTSEQCAYVIAHSDATVLFVDSSKFLSYVIEHHGEFGSSLRAIIALNDRVSLDKAYGYLEGKEGLPDRAELDRKLHSWSAAVERGARIARERPEHMQELLDAIDMEQGAVMLYTSGTTGLPKGVPLTHMNVGVNGQDWLIINGSLVEEGDRDVLWLPLSHIYGFGQLCLGNTLGFETYWSDPSRVMEDVARVKPQVFMSVPRLYEKIATAAMEEQGEAAQKAKLDEITGGNFRFCLSGGAGLKTEIKEFLHRHGILVIEGYGLTEASPTLTMNRPDNFRFDTVGLPFPSVELKLAEDGEILARGPNVFSGYHKNEEATREAFTDDGWLKTGDIGRWTDDGFIQIIDRKKEILVTAGGKNIPPANIEIGFRDDPYIAQVVAYGDGKPFISAGIWLNEEAVDDALSRDPSLTREALVQQRVDSVNEKLPRQETIRRFVIIDEPLTVENDLITPTLKVKRKKVYERFRDRFEALYER